MARHVGVSNYDLAQIKALQARLMCWRAGGLACLAYWHAWRAGVPAC